MKPSGLWFVFCGFCLAVQSVTPSLAVKKTQFDNQSEKITGNNKTNNQTYCSKQKIESVTAYLLRDLPSYANRVSQRSRRLTRRGDTFSYTIAAGRPEFQPLPLNADATSRDTAKTLSEGVEQVFFTTLERQYTAGKSVELQQFHWLLLTKTSSGWRKVMMFSQLGSFPVTKQPVSPPRESSDGVVAQAVDIWLRDCQAGSVPMS
jgi:hypothetical protein